MFIAAVLLLEGIVQSTTAQCVHPPDSERQKHELKNDVFEDYLLGRWTYNVINEYRKNTRPKRPGNLPSVQRKQRKLYGEKSCRKNRKIEHASDMGSSSTCPWYTVLDVDPEREPRAIAKAKCSCKHCFTVDRSRKPEDKCTEVNAFIPVVKWRCPYNFSGQGPNYFQYFIDFETVPIGCTCERLHEVIN